MLCNMNSDIVEVTGARNEKRILKSLLANHILAYCITVVYLLKQDNFKTLYTSATFEIICHL